MLQPVHRRGVERRRIADAHRTAHRFVRMRLHRCVAQGIEDKLGREVEILILAGVDLPRKVLHRGDARIEVAKLADAKRIRTAEDPLLSDRQLGLGPRRRQHDSAVADDVPECREIRAACETATHADDGDRIIHSQRLYQIKRASWHLGILRNGLMVHIYGKTLTIVTLPMRSVFFSRAVRSGSRAHGRNLTDTVLPTTSSFLMA